MIPSGWSEKRLHEIVVKNQLGGNFDNSEQNNGLPLIKMGNITRGSINLNKVLKVSDDLEPDEYNSFILKTGDLLFNTRNTLDLVGKVALYRGEFDKALYDLNLMRIEFDKNEVDSTAFMNYWFNSSNTIKILRSIATGTTSVAAIYNGDLFKLKLKLPPKNEQEKIAKILATWDKGIDLVISKIKKVELRFDWFLMELLASKASKSEKYSWKKYKLGDLAQFINGRGFKQSEWASKGLPIIRIQNLNGGVEFNYFDGDYDKKHFVNTGDLLFSWSGNRGTSFGPNIWGGQPGLLNQHIFKVQNTDLISKEFLYLVLKYATKIIENKAHGGSGLVHVTKAELEKFEVELPGSHDDFLVMSNLLLSKETELKLLKSKLALLETQKQGLMQQLLTGKKRVKV